MVTQEILHLPQFPYISNKEIYTSMFNREESLAELQYPLFNWKRIWSNYLSIFILPYDKEIIFKHLHMCLATNKKLFVMDITNSSVCNKCSTDSEQTPLHMFYQCEYVNPVFLWVLRCLFKLCNFKPSSNIKFIYFDTTYSNTYQRNICNVFLYVYIITIWRTRKEI